MNLSIGVQLNYLIVLLFLFFQHCSIHLMHGRCRLLAEADIEELGPGKRARSANSAFRTCPIKKKCPDQAGQRVLCRAQTRQLALPGRLTHTASNPMIWHGALRLAAQQNRQLSLSNYFAKYYFLFIFRKLTRGRQRSTGRLLSPLTTMLTLSTAKPPQQI